MIRAKAVANGAVLHFLDRSVTGRMLDISYGTSAMVPFIPFLPRHRERMDLVRPGPRGPMIGPIFSCIAKRVNFSCRYYECSVTEFRRVHW